MRRWFLLPLIAVLFPAVGAPPVSPPGLGELQLDATAVTELVRSRIPGPMSVEVFEGRTLTLLLSMPGRVRFASGGIEMRLVARVPEAGAEAGVSLRLEPRIDEKSGELLLVPVRSTGEGLLAFLPADGSWLPTARLPRGAQWLLDGEDAAPSILSLHLQECEILEERLVLRFALDVRPARRGAPGQDGRASGPGRT